MRNLTRPATRSAAGRPSRPGTAARCHRTVRSTCCRGWSSSAAAPSSRRRGSCMSGRPAPAPRCKDGNIISERLRIVGRQPGVQSSAAGLPTHPCLQAPQPAEEVLKFHSPMGLPSSLRECMQPARGGPRDQPRGVPQVQVVVLNTTLGGGAPSDCQVTHVTRHGTTPRPAPTPVGRAASRGTSPHRPSPGQSSHPEQNIE